MLHDEPLPVRNVIGTLERELVLARDKRNSDARATVYP